MGASWHALHSELLRSTTRLNFLEDFRQIRSRNPCLRRFHEPQGVLDHLHWADGDAEDKNELLKALVVEAQSGEHWVEASVNLVLLALWPGLDAARGRLKRKLGNPADLSADLVGRLSLAIRKLDLSRVNRIAATLLRNTERDMIRELARRAREAPTESEFMEAAGAVVFGPPEIDFSEARRDLRAHLDALLGNDADLVLTVAVDGYSQAEAAEMLGLSHDAARKRYQRALAALREKEIL